jgi:hypothetical protein
MAAKKGETEYDADNSTEPPDWTSAEVDEWIRELRRAHVYLDVGKPFLSGKDCAELADLLAQLLAATSAPAPAPDVAARDTAARHGDRKGFEAFAVQQGLALNPVPADTCCTRRGVGPATYLEDETEFAWRGWANRPVPLLEADDADWDPEARDIARAVRTLSRPPSAVVKETYEKLAQLLPQQ